MPAAAGITGRLLLLCGVTLISAAVGATAAYRSSSRTVLLGDNVTTALIKQCYGVYGCFAITKEWISLTRPINVLPQSPKSINVKFCLYTAVNTTECERLRDHDVASLRASSFLAGRPVKFLVHGYLDSGDKRWIKRMASELLAHEEQNVLVVDWVGGSGPPYTQAVANIRLVGAVVGHFIILLKETFGTSERHVHIIGHSLGAHLAGYAGEYLKKRQLSLSRITGLDPAEPHFENTDRVVRLDPTDANFVDVIHSDSGPLFSGGLGLLQPIGHLDFYPNGGKKQPGCGTSVLDAIKKEEGSLIYGLRRFIGCNHLRAYEYFTESINSRCPFMAYECDSWDHFASGMCAVCSAGQGNCHHLGYHADKGLTAVDLAKMRNMNQQLQFGLFSLPDVGRTFYLMTGNDMPFCRRHFRVMVFLSDIPAAIRHGGDMGAFRIRFLDDQGNITEWHRLSDSDIYFEPGQSYAYISPVSFWGDPTSVDLAWSYSSSLLNPLTWRLLSTPMIHINRVVTVDMESGKRYVFCGEDEAFKSGRPSRLRFNPRCRFQRPSSGGSIFAVLANIDLVGEVGDSVSGLVDSDQNVIPTRRRRRRRGRRRRHRRRGSKVAVARRRHMKKMAAASRRSRWG